MGAQRLIECCPLHGGPHRAVRTALCSAHPPLCSARFSWFWYSLGWYFTTPPPPALLSPPPPCLLVSCSQCLKPAIPPPPAPRLQAPLYGVLYMLVLATLLSTPMCFNTYVVGGGARRTAFPVR